jgi:hypothetical protein
MLNKIKTRKIAIHPPRIPVPKPEQAARSLKAEQDELLTEALKESFPASDPISSMRFTSL